MADSHPFANAGLGMFGTAEKAYAQAGMAGGNKGGLGSKLIGMALDKSGVKKFLDDLTADDSQKTIGIAPPAYKANINYGVQPVAPISPIGINPLRLPQALPGGIGFNAAPAGAVLPKTMQSPTTITPDEEHINQVKSSWG